MFKTFVKSARKSKLNLFGALIVATMSVSIGYAGYSLLTAKAAGVSMYLTPIKASSSLGKTVLVDVRADSLADAVNAAQVNVTYPASKLRYEGYDSQSGAFEIQASINDASGIVRIARGTTTPVSGDFKILTLRFTVVGSGKAQLRVDTTSALVRSSDAVDILQSYGVANYSLHK